ncbi:MAG: hypothetical protein NDJ92_03080 [Thermoanaerobaculia bacterium]|nr:hypothetical protein [Thermoanaerobaculia bacterium]
MPGIPVWAQLALVVVVIALAFVLVRFLNRDKIDGLLKKRRATSLIATPAEFIEGPTHLEVALALDTKKLYYENADMQAFLELANVDEVEYDDDLMTGGRKIDGEVLRLRAHGHTFEFVISKAEIAKWKQKLPKHRVDDPGSVHSAVATV